MPAIHFHWTVQIVTNEFECIFGCVGKDIWPQRTEGNNWQEEIIHMNKKFKEKIHFDENSLQRNEIKPDVSHECCSVQNGNHSVR